MTWAVTACVHIWPEADLMPHELGPDCPCGPEESTYEAPAGTTWFRFTHSSLDGRELSEPDHVPAGQEAPQ